MDLDGWNYTVINASGATVLFPSGRITYGGYIVVAGAGEHTMEVYDNGAASGQKLASAIPLNAAGNGVLTAGIVCKNGLTVEASGNPTDGMVLVLWR